MFAIMPDALHRQEMVAAIKDALTAGVVLDREAYKKAVKQRFEVLARRGEVAAEMRKKGRERYAHKLRDRLNSRCRK